MGRADLQREGGKAQITIQVDANGNMSVQCGGTLVLSEVIAGLELLKKGLLDEAARAGVMRTPRLNFENSTPGDVEHE